MSKDLKTERERTRKIIKRLRAAHPEAHCSLNYQTPFQLLVATILSAQCTDERVNMVTPELFVRYPTPKDLAAAELADLEHLIRSTGFFRNKAKSIQGAAQKIVTEFNGAVPQTMEELLRLPGVARKTANVVLGNAYGIASGVVVDTHVHRLSQRLALTEHERPEKIEQDLIELVPQKDWVDLPHLMIAHGRKVCKARTPLCAECVLSPLCPSSRVSPSAGALKRASD